MQATRFSFITREDTLLGVCAALGEDFGFNPTWLRIVFAVLLLWNPVAVLSTYFGLFALIVASRLLFPSKRVAEQPQAEAAPALPAHQNDVAVELPLAA
jgi:phage shock protein PspC (stress-responsive transcriptional regulator)